jgi:hypothetical protein
MAQCSVIVDTRQVIRIVCVRSGRAFVVLPSQNIDALPILYSQCVTQVQGTILVLRFYKVGKPSSPHQVVLY